MPPIKGWKKTSNVSSKQIWQHRETNEYVNMYKEGNTWFVANDYMRREKRFQNKSEAKEFAVSFMRRNTQGSDPGIAKTYIQNYFEENTMRAEKEDMIRETSLTERDLDRLSDQEYISYTRFSGKNWVMWVY
jgi:hypothetical protein